MPRLELGLSSVLIESGAHRGGRGVPAYSNNYSIVLDGTNDVVDLRDGGTTDPAGFPLGNSARTMSAWVKPTTVSGGPYHIFSYGNADQTEFIGWSQKNQAMRVDQYKAGGNVPTTSNIMVADEWQHVVLVLSGGTGVLMYRNGSNTATNFSDFTSVLDTVHGAYGTTIGGIFWSSNFIQTYPGNIDEVAIWNVELDADAITAIYNSGVPIDLASDSGNYDNSGDLVGYWRFEEGSGTEAAETTGTTNVYAGTLTNGAAYSTDIPE